MLRRTLVPVIGLTLAVAATSVAAPALLKWPPWISIESPVNPFDASTRGAAFLVHAMLREGTPAMGDVTGTAEGLVNGARKTIPLRIDKTSHPGVFAVSKQWPAEGTWLLRISFHSTTALVAIDRNGNVGAATIPTRTLSGSNDQVPRSVTASEIDTMLASAAKQ